VALECRQQPRPCSAASVTRDRVREVRLLEPRDLVVAQLQLLSRERVYQVLALRRAHDRRRHAGLWSSQVANASDVSDVKGSETLTVMHGSRVEQPRHAHEPSNPKTPAATCPPPSVREVRLTSQLRGQIRNVTPSLKGLTLGTGFGDTLQVFRKALEEGVRRREELRMLQEKRASSAVRRPCSRSPDPPW
jgi:hypothetical protein